MEKYLNKEGLAYLISKLNSKFGNSNSNNNTNGNENNGTTITSLDWKDITNKPFGKEEITILDTTILFSDIDNIAIVPDESDSILQLNEIYTVIWKGQEYHIKCGLTEGVINSLGDYDTLNNGTLPFVIIRDLFGLIGGLSCWVIISADPEDYEKEVAVTVKFTEMKYLDNECLSFI